MTWVNLALAIVFVLLRSVFDPWMRSLYLWIAYGIEFSICVAFVALNLKTIRWKFTVKKSHALHAITSLTLGAVIAYLGGRTGHAVPFDFTQSTLWLQLIIIAPLLEEAIFRLLIWNSLGNWVRREAWLVPVTAVLFSLSHFAAYFYVPEEFRSFVIYQSIYTLVLGLYWGAARYKTGSWLAPVALHFLVNLSFGLTHVAIAKFGLLPVTREKVKILIVDMPIADLEAFKQIKSPAQIYAIVDPNLEALPADPKADCAADASKASEFFENQLRTKPTATRDEELEAISKFTIRSHGYHVLGLVQQGLSDSEIYTLGANPPPGDNGIKDADAYIESHIQKEFARMREAIAELNPDIVLVATSETFEENFSDLQLPGVSDDEATVAANKIVIAWSESWASLVNSFPQSEFVVPAGNGGIDGVGDDVSAGNVVPASLMAANLTKVASVGADKCLSKFSNYHPLLVDVAVAGELVSSWSACEKLTYLKLSGTSQSSAIFANRLARAMEQGLSKTELLESSVPAAGGCLEGKVKFGLIAN